MESFTEVSGSAVPIYAATVRINHIMQVAAATHL